MNKILEMEFGSKLYGTSTPKSDKDFKGIYLPSAREIVLHTYKKTISTSRPKQECERNTKDDVDSEYFSLDRFLELLVEGQTVALDMLFSPDFCSHAITKEIYDNREKLLTNNITSFLGYAKMQAARYGIKGSRMDALKRVNQFLSLLPDHTRLAGWEWNLEQLVLECQSIISLEKIPLIEIVMLKGPKGLIDAPHLKVNGRSIPFHATIKYAREVVGKMLESYGQRAYKAHLAGGKDFKAISHCIRVCSEAAELLETGNITFPRPDRELLLKVKLGLVPYEEVEEMMEKGIEQIVISQSKSMLRDHPDNEWAENFIFDIYSNIVNSYCMS